MLGYGDAEVCAQAVWQLICRLVQLSLQDTFLLALLPVVAAPVGGATRHVVWQVAACELHDIMQLVTIEVCAIRNRVAACPEELLIATANPPQKITRAIPPQRMTDPPVGNHHSVARRVGECTSLETVGETLWPASPRDPAPYAASG